MLNRLSNNVQHILVIDDAPAVCDMIKKVLENQGHIVMVTTTGADALELLEDIRFDKIFLDLRLPDMDVTEVLKRIRAINSKVL